MHSISDTSQVLELFTCRECHCAFHAEVAYFEGRAIFAPSLCESCLQQMQERNTREAEIKAKEDRERDFWRKVPPVYRDTDPTRLSPILARMVTGWKYGPKGVGIVGKSGEGKTRSATMLLHRIHSEGMRVCYLPAMDLAASSANMFSDDREEKAKANARIKEAFKADLLLIDDLGKNRMTDRAESTLYDLFETRTGNMLPTIWTSNASAPELHKMFSEDRADAIIRRMGKEFSTIITV